MSLFNKNEIISIAKELPEYEDLREKLSDTAAWNDLSCALVDEIIHDFHSSFEEDIKPSIKKSIEADIAAERNAKAFKEVAAAIKKYNNYTKENNINNRIKFYYENIEPNQNICDMIDRIFESFK